MVWTTCPASISVCILTMLWEAPMHLVFAFFIALLLVTIVYHGWQRVPKLPRAAGDWGTAETDDPRIAVAGMMYAVATEDGPLTAEEERHILSLLTTTVALDPAVARKCLTGGRRAAARLRGDLNSRLHQLKAPIERNCSRQEKEDVVEMLRAVAGSSAERVSSVRDGLGRLSATLLNG